jgi:hypothetical protein
MHRPQREPARSSTTGTRRPAHRWTHPPSEARRSSPHPTRQPDLSPADLRAFDAWVLGGMPAPSEHPPLAPPRDVTPPGRQPTRTRTIRSRPLNAYDRFKRLVSTTALMLFCGAMWMIGASFTVEALHMTLGNLWGYHALLWLVPIVLTMYELTYLPFVKTTDATRIGIWLVIAGFDIGTTSLGMQPVLAETALGQFAWTFEQMALGGWTLTVSAVWVVAGILGTIFALVAEPLALHLWRTR